MNRPIHPPASQHGAALLESLVAMLIVAFGVLGFVGLQARTAVGNLEGYQRAQALVLLNDMVQRMNVNRKNAGSYLATDIGTGAAQNCGALTGAALDLCEWGNLIRGAAEKDAGNANVGAVISGRGCIARPTADTNEYLVSVVWQGIQASGPTPIACGQGNYANENLRRGVSQVVRIATLGT